METIGIIGIGKLGLCLALNLERKGYNVIGADVSESYVESINRKTLRTTEPGVEDYLRTSTHFRATTATSEIVASGCEVIFIVVATPSLPGGGYDHSQVDGVLRQLEVFGRQTARKHLVINCTTMPGYCDTLVEAADKLNYSITYNPEFIAQGSVLRDQVSPDQVLIGEGENAPGDLLEKIYRTICINQPVFFRMSRISAEIAKLATNCFLTTKIALANAIGDLAIRSGAEHEKILQAIAADSRIGGSYFRYGFGYGGPCFPRDNKALQAFASTVNYPVRISIATEESNRQHLEFQYEEWMDMYPQPGPVRFDYVTYKKGAPILEESQQLELALKLAQAGRNVIISETQDVVDQLKSRYGDLFTYEITNHA